MVSEKEINTKLTNVLDGLLMNKTTDIEYSTTDIQTSVLNNSNTTDAIFPLSNPSNGINSRSFNIIISNVTGTAPTLDMGIDESLDNGLTWIRIYTFPRITTIGTYSTPGLQIIGTCYRYVQVIGGTSASFTRSINILNYSHRGQIVRNFFNRSINVNTLGSTTAITGQGYTGGFYIDGTNTYQLTVNMNSIGTTAPQFVIDCSDDGVNWCTVSAPLTGVSNSTVVTKVSGYISKFARVRISTAGVGANLNYVLLKAMNC